MKKVSNTIDIMVYVETKKTNGKKWRKFSTKYEFLETGKTGRFVHFPQIKFKDGAFINTKLTEKDISRGILTCDKSKVNIRERWEKVLNEKTGKEEYPKCWIEEGAIISFTPKPKEHEFHFVVEDDGDEELAIEENDDESALEELEDVEESNAIDLE